MLSFFRLIRYAVYNVYCYSSEDWFANEDQMEGVIVDVEMFMTRNKQGLALKYHKSKSLPRKIPFLVEMLHVHTRFRVRFCR